MVDIAGKEKKNLAIGLGDEMVGLVFHWLSRKTFMALADEGLLYEAKQIIWGLPSFREVFFFF